MDQLFYLYNNYSTSYLAIDPTTSGFGLRAQQASDSPLVLIFTPIASSSLVKICTAGTAKTYCLDVYGDKKYTPHLADPGNTSGQQWSIIPAQTAFKLSNQYTGQGWFLDVYSDTKAAFMSDQDYAGQYWIKEDASANAQPTSSHLTPQSQPTLPSTPLPSAKSGAAPRLNASAKRGIGIGCGLLVVAIGALVFGLLLRKKRQQTGSSGSPAARQSVFWADPKLEAKPQAQFQPRVEELPAHSAVHEMPGRGTEHLPK